ncbi:hypothetical protein [Pseudomonas lundensis]|uniref:hypothetical protein n=1 Tax=Pseudomonas lundensis TaxID=86185 RepID=UPI001868409E|nr:hypothetical protein [Pseudomonas lundensis]
MSVLFDLKGRGYSDSTLPDSPKSIIGCMVLDGNIVVSRTPDGSVLSRAKDKIWNMKSYCPKSICMFNFENWTRSPQDPHTQQIIQEMQTIQLVRLHYFPKSRKVGSVKITALRKVAELAEKNMLSLGDLFNRTSSQEILISSLSKVSSKSVLRGIYDLFLELYRLRLFHPQFSLAPSDYEFVERIGALAGTYAEYAESLGQTKLIPSRIYAQLIAGFDDELTLFNAHSSQLLEFYTRKSEDPLFGSCCPKRARKSVVWADAIAGCKIKVLCDRFGLEHINNLNSYLNSVSTLAKHWIHIFTGMRDNEVRTLPANTLTSMRVGDQIVTLLRGYTSKTAGVNNFETYWISAPIVEKAIAAAKTIGRIAAIKSGWDDSDLSCYPLFPLLAGSEKDSVAYIYSTAPLQGKAQAIQISNLKLRIPNIEITESDIIELERFDGFRDWRSDPKIEIGKPWPINSHQYRRSLAVYSARSGMVSLGALANQFKHLAETMASYYRSDQIFAVNFLASEDQQALIRELEYERRVASLANYEIDVINSSGRLWGGEGNRIQVARDRGRPLIITTDREITARKFDKGEMIWKEGPLGGCTNLNSCDRIGFISIFACLDCKYSVLDDNKSIKKIRYGISNLQQSRAMFPATSPFYKQLSLELDTVFSQVGRAGFGHEIEDLK